MRWCIGPAPQHGPCFHQDIIGSHCSEVLWQWDSLGFSCRLKNDNVTRWQKCNIEEESLNLKATPRSYTIHSLPVNVWLTLCSYNTWYYWAPRTLTLSTFLLLSLSNPNAIYSGKRHILQPTVNILQCAFPCNYIRRVSIALSVLLTQRYAAFISSRLLMD